MTTDHTTPTRRRRSLLAGAALVTMLATACGGGGGDDGSSSSSNTTRNRATAEQTSYEPVDDSRETNTGSNRFVSSFNGAEAVATVGYDRGYNNDVMSGTIQSGGYTYTFSADIVGTSGYGELVDYASYDRMTVHLDLYSNGFYLTINPFGHPATYFFESA